MMHCISLCDQNEFKSFPNDLYNSQMEEKVLWSEGGLSLCAAVRTPQQKHAL